MSDNAEPTQPSEPEEAPVELRGNNQANDTNSNTTSYDSEEDDMVHSLRASATTVGVTNRTTRDNKPRGNSSSSSSSSRRSKKERHERRKKSKGNSSSPLRTKFQIESLHLQIFELKKQNEFLKCLLVEAQQHSPSRHQLEVPSTVQVSSDTTNNTDESDLDSSNRGKDEMMKDEMNMEFNQLSFTKEEDEMNMEFNQLSCA